MLYALGEITLVMIGILLAFQVDSWNENKNLTKKEITNLKEIQKNLKSDLENQLIPGSEYYQLSEDAYNILQSNFLKHRKAFRKIQLENYTMTW